MEPKKRQHLQQAADNGHQFESLMAHPSWPLMARLLERERTLAETDLKRLPPSDPEHELAWVKVTVYEELIKRIEGFVTSGHNAQKELDKYGD